MVHMETACSIASSATAPLPAQTHCMEMAHEPKSTFARSLSLVLLASLYLEALDKPDIDSSRKSSFLKARVAHSSLDAASPGLTSIRR